MLNRRLFLSALLCAPATVFAAEDGFLGDILGGIADRARTFLYLSERKATEYSAAFRKYPVYLSNSSLMEPPL